MAKQVLTNVNVTLAGTDISSSVAAITLTTSAAEVPTTAFGSTSVTRVSGLLDNSVTLDLHQQYSEIDALIFPLVGSTAVTMVVKPNGTAAASSANPSYTFSVLCTNWTPVAGAVGELATASVTWPISGAITVSRGA
jgi:hypothetical protein